MPYFLRHYLDFKSCCPRKPYWAFIVSSQLILTLLALPAIIYLWLDLLAFEPIIQLCVDILDYLDEPAVVQHLLHEEAPQLLSQWAMGIPNTLLAADALTRVCSVAFLAGGAFCLIPSLSLSACRLRDAGFSPYLLLLVLIGYASLGLRFSPWSELCAILDNINLLAMLVLFVLLCLPSKAPLTERAAQGE